MKAQCIAMVAAAFTMSATATPASAALIVSGASWSVAPGSFVPLQFLVTDSGPPSASDIEGMTFTAQIDSGLGASPSITGIDLLNGTIWNGSVSAGSISVPSGGNQLQYQSRDLRTDAPGEYVDANGLFATVGIDTTGAAPGVYTIELIGTKIPGSDSAFLNGLGETVSATFGTGSVTVVPEPSTLLLGLCGVSGIMLLRSRRFL